MLSIVTNGIDLKSLLFAGCCYTCPCSFEDKLELINAFVKKIPHLNERLTRFKAGLNKQLKNLSKWLIKDDLLQILRILTNGGTAAPSAFVLFGDPSNCQEHYGDLRFWAIIKIINIIEDYQDYQEIRFWAIIRTRIIPTQMTRTK